MARKHARLLLTIWDDPHWRALTSAQQSTYLALLASKDLSWCGVAPLLPQRLAGSAADLTEGKVRSSLKVLADQPGRFLVVDEATAEVAVRSYVRHDEILKQPNIRKAMVKGLDRVHSRCIRDTIIAELRRTMNEEPNQPGWKTFPDDHPQLFAELIANPLRRAS